MKNILPGKFLAVLVGVVLVIVGVLYFTNVNKFEDQKGEIVKALESAESSEEVAFADASIFYGGDGMYEMDMFFVFMDTSREDVLSYFTSELENTDIKFKEIKIKIYDNIDPENGNRNYINEGEDMVIKGTDFK